MGKPKVPVEPQTSAEPEPADAGIGAVEGDSPDDQQQGNRNGDGLDSDGMPDDATAIAEDVIGANEDETQG
jgi:hypothetical protein